MKNKFLLAAILFALTSTVNAQIASGGIYALERSVIASGGGESTGGNFKIEGTGGQSAAGVTMTNSTFSLTGGFWIPVQLAPTAAGVSVGGRVINSLSQQQTDEVLNPKEIQNLSGIGGAHVTLTGGPLTAPRVVLTNRFGFFEFTDVEAGHYYVVTVRHKKYGFAQQTQAFTLFDNRCDIVFQANWEN